MFEIAHSEILDRSKVWSPDYRQLPSVIDGAELYDTLCPVSKETGIRENALTLLTKVLDPSKQHLVESILQYMPTLNERPGVSDDDSLDMLMHRFDQGTPYENDLLRSKFESMLDVLVPVRQPKEGSIQFDPKDTPKEPQSE